ncbi:uncharacterized protein A4U43_C03F27220 [Asparagus officinalis]|uniref:Uncharacterized protein n=1 Tax=Asparagus officinalis TaxID=4686 RepID=A0A5P1FE98_ASPOF|nr:uncharacterized protein A4U43_C03F27220 [Asparagus officinalis]
MAYKKVVSEEKTSSFTTAFAAAGVARAHLAPRSSWQGGREQVKGSDPTPAGDDWETLLYEGLDVAPPSDFSARYDLNQAAIDKGQVAIRALTQVKGCSERVEGGPAKHIHMLISALSPLTPSMRRCEVDVISPVERLVKRARHEEKSLIHEEARGQEAGALTPAETFVREASLSSGDSFAQVTELSEAGSPALCERPTTDGGGTTSPSVLMVI